MEIIRSGITKGLIARYSRTGVLFLIGFVLIIYIGLGFVYFQQGTQQRELMEQIAQLGAIVARPLASGEELQAKYEEVNLALAPLTDAASLDPATPYIALIVGIAEKSGIDVTEAAGGFSVPQAKFSQQKMSGSNYQLLSFNGISVSGNYTNVMAFISDLDSGETLGTMVLKRVEISHIELAGETTATVDVDIYTKP